MTTRETTLHTNRSMSVIVDDANSAHFAALGVPSGSEVVVALSMARTGAVHEASLEIAGAEPVRVDPMAAVALLEAVPELQCDDVAKVDAAATKKAAEARFSRPR